MKWRNARRTIDVRKNARYALVINGLQIIMTLIIVGIVLFSPYFAEHMDMTRLIVLGAAVLAMWGAVVDIREAIAARRTLFQVQDMAVSLNNIEALHHTLRAQRHDFLNHLQVVYSLMEMEEYQEANEYIEKVYGSISAVSRSLKTKNTPVNALLQVKIAAMEKSGIECDLNITSAWEDLVIPGWEMCRVLSNLIDNAMDAVENEKSKRISLTLGENLKQFTFCVANDGPMVPRKLPESIFEPGFTTKADGRGMGLFIVKRTLENYGGEIEVESGDGRTTFMGTIPKAGKLLSEDAFVTNGRKS